MSLNAAGELPGGRGGEWVRQDSAEQKVPCRVRPT